VGKRIVSIACVGKKNPPLIAARDLWSSDRLRKGSTDAVREADEWYTLLVKHGVVSPTEVIESYNEMLKKMPAAVRRLWARQVMDEWSLLHKKGGHL
jgi:hypothetical protein